MLVREVDSVCIFDFSLYILLMVSWVKDFEFGEGDISVKSEDFNLLLLLDFVSFFLFLL